MEVVIRESGIRYEHVALLCCVGGMNIKLFTVFIEFIHCYLRVVVAAQHLFAVTAYEIWYFILHFVIRSSNQQLLQSSPDTELHV